MSQPTMNNEQFALWIALGQGKEEHLFARADTILKWLNKDIKKPAVPLMPKTK
jgi:uncharacterized protein YgfB (UPF0149 family)